MLVRWCWLSVGNKMLLTMIFRKDYELMSKYNLLNMSRKLKVNFIFTAIYLVIALFVPFWISTKAGGEDAIKLQVIFYYFLFFLFFGNGLTKKIVRFFAIYSIQRNTNKQYSLASNKAKKEQELMESKQYQKRIKEAEELEFAKARGQSKAMLSLYGGQLRLLEDHKKRGLNIEKESFELRKKLLELETEENEKMINDLLRTLDKI